MGVITKYWHDTWRDLTVFGGFGFYVLLLLLVLVLGNLTLFIHLLLGLVLMLASVVLIRLLYFKNRPKKQSYTNILEKIDASSFPSLHAAKAFFLALTFMSFLAFGGKIVLLFVAALTGYSRIHLQKHDWIDVVFGMLLGIGVWYLVMLI